MPIQRWLLALFLILFAVTAQARDYYVDITNDTGYTIYYLYVSPDKSTSWEEDVLGSEVMLDGATRRVTLTGYKSPIFDIKLVDSDGDSYTFWGVDVSRRDLVVTLGDLD
ncbi:hypothetical protein [Halomonas icarae]|uniref:Uncharacterized protein n=1 Tax=Halomonas icarae TaxID=2691040 RepID=A0A7X5ANF4_9GAMM|nr:hypothetical protein [Halomonas icarae]MDR5900672.1 hypothetical protein [Halomonas icarae]NAW13859.1 hypothetical protein [Halomonas icarae]